MANPFLEIVGKFKSRRLGGRADRLDGRYHGKVVSVASPRVPPVSLGAGKAARRVCGTVCDVMVAN